MKKSDNGSSNKVKDTTTTDRITALATVIIMIATTAYSVIAHKQLDVMEKQSVAAFQQLSTANNNVKIARGALDASQKSSMAEAARAERITKANENISRASVLSIETAKQIARKSLDTTTEYLHFEQRPWIELIDVSSDEGTTADFLGGSKHVTLTLMNVGKTPAVNLTDVWAYESKPDARSKSNYNTINSVELVKKSPYETYKPPIIYSSGPDGNMVTNESVINLVRPKTDIKLFGPIDHFKDPSLITQCQKNNFPACGNDCYYECYRKVDELYIVVEIKYSDIFNGTPEHITRIVLSYNNNLKKFVASKKGSWMD